MFDSLILAIVGLAIIRCLASISNRLSQIVQILNIRR